MYKLKADGKKNLFNVTFTRATNWDIGLMTVEHGDWIIWAVIGSLFCVIFCCMYCLWHRCTKGKKDNENFYTAEDCYARV